MGIIELIEFTMICDILQNGRFDEGDTVLQIRGHTIDISDFFATSYCTFWWPGAQMYVRLAGASL